MKKKTVVLLSLAILVFSTVAALVLFSSAFDDSVRGSAFEVMMGTRTGYKPVVWLIVAFSLECLAFLLGLVNMTLHGKANGIVFFLIALVLIAAAVLFGLSKVFYVSANPGYISNEDGFALGAGTITSIVFAGIGGAVALLSGYRALKA